MQTVTFPCAFCGKRMGVGANLCGKRVRCPNCKQVVTAPETAAVAAPTPAQPLVPPPPMSDPVVATVAPPEEEPMFPAFSTGPKESAESILSPPEESEDEVFGTAGGNKLRMPELLREPDPPPAPAPEPAAGLPDNPFAFSAAPAPAPAAAEPAPPPPPRVEEFVAEMVPEAPPLVASPAPDTSNPFAAFEADPAPPPAAPAPPPVAVVAQPAEEWGGFGGLDAGREQPVAETVPHKTEPAAPRRGRVAEPAADDPTKPWRLAVYILGPYALLMTILAIAGFAGGSSKPESTPKKKAERSPAAAMVRPV